MMAMPMLIVHDSSTCSVIMMAMPMLIVHDSSTCSVIMMAMLMLIVLSQYLNLLLEPQLKRKLTMEVWRQIMSLIQPQAAPQAITIILHLGVIALHPQEPGTLLTSKLVRTKKYRMNKLARTKKYGEMASRSSPSCNVLL